MVGGESECVCCLNKILYVRNFLGELMAQKTVLKNVCVHSGNKLDKVHRNENYVFLELYLMNYFINS